MKVKIKDEIYSSSQEPIMLVFENDEQRKRFITALVNMPDKEGVRKFCEAPKGMNEDEQRAFMKI